MLFRHLDVGTGPAGEQADRREVVEVLTAAIRGADAYAAVRRAARLEEGVLRVGNRFLERSKVREVAFLAVGRCAAAMARGLHDALGEVVTQGLVAGPEPPPEPWPFLYRQVQEGTFPSPEGAALAHEAAELAQGLGPHDLFLPLLSPGALGMLASPPRGMGLEEYRELLQVVAASAPWREELPVVAASLSPLQGGGLGVAAGEAATEALVVERGEGGDRLGAGPVVPPPPDLRRRTRSLLQRAGLLARLPPAVLATLEEEAPLPATGRPRPHNVVVAGPADALETSGAEAAYRKHRPRLVALHDPAAPEAAADRLIQALEERAGHLPAKEGEGIALFMGVSFGEPEAGETREGLVRFLARAQHGLTRRGATVALLATVGSLGEALTPSGALVDARTPFDPAALVRKGPRTLDLRPGFTDVGTIAVAYLTRRGHRGP